MNWTDIGIGAGALAVILLVGGFLYVLVKSYIKKTTALNAKETEITSKVELIETIILENGNSLKVNETSRKAFENLQALNTDNTDLLKLEAMKAKAKREKLSAKEIKKTQEIKLF